jgi:hypothetical protein
MFHVEQFVSAIVYVQKWVIIYLQHMLLLLAVTGLLGVCLYVWTVVLPRPARPEGAYLQNAIGWSDMFGVGRSGDCHHAVNYVVGDAGYSRRSNFLVVLLNIFAHGRLGGCEQTDGIGGRTLNERTAKLPLDHMQFHNFSFDAVNIRTEKVKLQDSSAVANVTVIKGFGIPTHVGSLSLHNRDHRVPIRGSNLIKSTARFDRLADDLIGIKMALGARGESLVRPEKLSRLLNLTCRETPPTGHLDGHAVGGEVHGLCCSDNHNLGSDRLRREPQPRQHQADWKYMRFGDVGSGGYTIDKDTGSLVLLLANQDIDLSKDGKHWFHIAGPHCFTDAKQIRKKKRRIVPKTGTQQGVA